MEKIEVLWSGGWDSTFMLCLLAKTKDAVIQPFYLDIHRHIRKRELMAVSAILKVLRKKKDLKAVIRPVRYVDMKYFSPAQDVLDAFDKYKSEPYLIGGQQRYIAEFSKSHKGICWGQERYLETPGHMTRLLYEKGHMKFDKDGVGYFDRDDCDPDVFTLFGNLSCPVAKYSELMMWDKIREWHYEDVFSHISFCYYPVDGKPCGVCLPCRVKLKQGLTWFFDEAALKRNVVWKKLDVNKDVVRFGSGRLTTLFERYCCPDYNKEFVEKVGDDSSLGKLLRQKVEDELGVYSSYFDALLK